MLKRGAASKTADIQKPTKTASAGTLFQGIVDGVDDRKQITSLTEPYCFICFVKLGEGLQSTWGSGALIADNVVLTAAHNFYSHDNKAYVYKVEVIFTNSDHTKPIKASLWAFPTSYFSDKSEDYALILLEESPFTNKAHFELGFGDDENLNMVEGKNVHLAGYPKDKDEHGRTMWESNLSIGRKNAEGMWEHKCATGRGESGAPLWFYTSSKSKSCIIVGVHTTDEIAKNGYNKAIAITNSRRAAIFGLMVELTANGKHTMNASLIGCDSRDPNCDIRSSVDAEFSFVSPKPLVHDAKDAEDEKVTKSPFGVIGTSTIPAPPSAKTAPFSISEQARNSDDNSSLVHKEGREINPTFLRSLPKTGLTFEPEAALKLGTTGATFESKPQTMDTASQIKKSPTTRHTGATDTPLSNLND